VPGVFCCTPAVYSFVAGVIGSVLLSCRGIGSPSLIAVCPTRFQEKELSFRLSRLLVSIFPRAESAYDGRAARPAEPPLCFPPPGVVVQLSSSFSRLSVWYCPGTAVVAMFQKKAPNARVSCRRVSSAHHNQAIQAIPHVLAHRQSLPSKERPTACAPSTRSGRVSPFADKGSQDAAY